MAILHIIVAAILAASSNLCLKKNSEHGGSSKAYLSVYFIVSFGVSFLLSSKHLDIDHLSFTISLLGIVTGILNFFMMALTACALQIGPSGLTFAFQNSGTLLPSLFMCFLFGSAFGFQMTPLLVVGFLCILCGLYLSSRMQRSSQAKLSPNHPSLSREDNTNTRFSSWLGLAICIFLVQGVILTLFQWKSLLLYEMTTSHVLIPLHCTKEEDAWFMPSFFIIPAIAQTIFFAISERRRFSSKEAWLGILGGSLNAGATFFLLLATIYATGSAKIILFPLFAICVIFLCSLWGKKLYQEKIDWLGISLCFAGVFVGAF